jgi:hypothetical protein
LLHIMLIFNHDPDDNGCQVMTINKLTCSKGPITCSNRSGDAKVWLNTLIKENILIETIHREGSSIWRIQNPKIYAWPQINRKHTVFLSRYLPVWCVFDMYYNWRDIFSVISPNFGEDLSLLTRFFWKASHLFCNINVFPWDSIK